MKRTIISFIILLALVGVTFYFNTIKTGSVEVKPVVGYQAPDFTIQDMEGNTLNLADLKGKPIFINFWASWCPPCRAEMPHIQAAYEKYGGQIQFVMINTIEADTLEDLKAYIGEAKLTFPVYLDKKNLVNDLYQVPGWPTSLFINKKGIIVERLTRPMTAEMTESLMQSILK
ncbi:MAG: TlpA family protein disulfide reductase [Thermicanus sp.]|nr:TlpA family protein disulfide reductase [Thermicanus sp.]